jgi:hypothetical protein
MQRARRSREAGVTVAARSTGITHAEAMRYDSRIFFEDPRWQTASDANGAATVTGLPPRTPLTVTAYRGALQARPAQPLELEPGEERSLELRLSGGTRIRGTLVDADGRALPGQEIWCTPAPQDSREMFDGWRERELRARAVTGEHGEFGLSPLRKVHGRWGSPLRKQTSVARRRSPACRAIGRRRFPVEAIDVVLVGKRGGFLTGRVLDPEGQPIGLVHVWAQSVDDPRQHSSADADAEGAFVLGPLPPGRYGIEGLHDAGFAGSLPVTAETGATDVVVVLRAAGRIRAIVIDAATGEKREAVVLYGEVDRWDSGGETPALNGELLLDSLPPGVYSIVAKTRDGLFGSRTGLVVRAGETLEDVPIVVSPGGSLRLRYDGPEPKAGYRVLVHGRFFATGTLLRSETAQIVVPADMLTVAVRREEKEVSVAAGAVVEVAFGTR